MTNQLGASIAVTSGKSETMQTLNEKEKEQLREKLICNEPKVKISNHADSQIAEKRPIKAQSHACSELMQELVCKLSKKIPIAPYETERKVEKILADDTNKKWESFADELEHKLHGLKSSLDKNYSTDSDDTCESSREYPPPQRVLTPSPPAKSPTTLSCGSSEREGTLAENDRESVVTPLHSKEKHCGSQFAKQERSLDNNLDSKITKLPQGPKFLRSETPKFRSYQPNIHLSKKCLNLITNITVSTGKECCAVTEPVKRNSKNTQKRESRKSAVPHQTEASIQFESPISADFRELANLEAFKNLKSVSLSRKKLQKLPTALCNLPNLVRLDLSWNNIAKLPVFSGNLRSLEYLVLAHNQIERASFSTLDCLKYLDVSNNLMPVIPALPPQPLQMLDMSNNMIWNTNRSSYTVLDEHNIEESSKNAVVLKLKKNRLRGAVTLASLQHVTELDVSENGITCLDVSSLTALKSLTCSNNEITRLSIHGASLVKLVADNNKITTIQVRSHPRILQCIDVSRNSLSCFPPWMVSCSDISHIDISHNSLTSLPAYLTSGHLRHLRVLSASQNLLTALPTAVLASSGKLQICPQNGIEILKLDQNYIEALPDDFFSCFTKIRVLNISSNNLSSLPSISQDEPPPPIQELYAANNNLTDVNSLEECYSMRILHVPFNEISNLSERLIHSWELLEELVVSGNQLSELPSSISRLSRLKVFRCYFNNIGWLPKLSHLSHLRVIDASYCNLGRVEFESILGPSLSTLDLASNPSLCVDKRQFSKCKSRRPFNVVNSTIGKKNIPFQYQQERSSVRTEDPYSPDKESIDSTDSPPARDLPWTIGFSETTGGHSKLPLAQMRVPAYADEQPFGAVAIVESQNDPSSAVLFVDILSRLLKSASTHRRFTNTENIKEIITRSLEESSIRSNAPMDSFCMACLQISKRLTFDPRGKKRSFQAVTLKIFSFGDATAVLCSRDANSQAVVVSASDTQNVGGVDSSLDVLDSESPDQPIILTTSVQVEAHHQCLIIGSESLWSVLRLSEANQIARENPDPLLAAKKMVTLAQSYGSKTSISCIVVQLTTPQEWMDRVPANIFSRIVIPPNIPHRNPNQRGISPRSYAESTPTDTDSDVSLDRYMRPERPIERQYHEDLSLVSEERESSGPFFPSYISPPDQFADTDSEGSSDDSGFSCNSGCKSDSPTNAHLQYRISDDQHELDSYISRRTSPPRMSERRVRKSPWISSLSTPDIVYAANQEGSMFEGFLNRTSSFSATSRKISREFKKCIQNTMHLHASKKLSNFSNFRFGSGTFKRFGSLQNLRSYQKNKSYKAKWDTQLTRKSDVTLRPEMQERNRIDKNDLECRMKHYWESGVTCF